MRRRGTEQARSGLDLEGLYALHRDGVLRFLARRTADPEVALDLWAETWAQAAAARQRARARSPEEQAAWLYAIARGQLAGWYRRGTAERRALDRLRLERPAAAPELLAEIAERAGLAELREELRAGLHRLSPAVRDAVRLRVLDELPYPDVARRLGTTEPAARARVSRGLAALADDLDTPMIRKALQA